MKKPLLFITGFLGAGKTTLLRFLVGELRANGYRCDVILNDFANAEMEAAMFRETVATIAPVAASCACCESLDELVSLGKAAIRGRGDVLLVELNGTADPWPILESFAVVEGLQDFHPRFQVNVVDARYWGQRGAWNALERRQQETAGWWILNHEKGESGRGALVAEQVGASGSHARQTEEAQLARMLNQLLEGSFEGEVSDPRAELDLPSKEQDPVHQLSHAITSCKMTLPIRVRQRNMEALFASLPASVMRAKAVVKLVEKPGSFWLFQRVGQSSLSPIAPVPNAGGELEPSLVCVGAALDPEGLNDLVRQQFGEWERA